MGVAGLFLGVTKILLALILGVIIAGVFSVFTLKNRRQNDTETKTEKEHGLKLHEIPFGPYLAAACFISLLYGQQIVTWYLSLY